MRSVLFLFVVCTLCSAQSTDTTRAFVDGKGHGVSGYRHPAKIVKVRVVIWDSLGMSKRDAVDFSSAGVGWQVEVFPGIGMRDAKELMPISIHEYRLRAENERWPSYELLGPTSVFRQDRASGIWQVVATSGRRFAWAEGFILQHGDVITLREVDPY